MHLFSLPPSKWPWYFHAAGACLTVTAMIGVAGLLVYSTANEADKQRQELRALETRLQALLQDDKKRHSGNFMQALPLASSADEVVHDMGRHAQALKIQVASLSIAVADPLPGLIRKVQFNLTASGEYASMKDWLAAMLGRYPSLGVQALSLRGLPSDALRQEIQLVLVLFVRD